MWQKLQTYIFVTVITVLIWLYAEGENLKEDKLYADIQFVAPTGRQLLIDPLGPTDPILVTVRGPTMQLAKLKHDEDDPPMRIEVLDDPNSDSPMREIDLFEALANHAHFTDLGIEVIEVVPRRVNVRVERFLSRTLPVEAPPPGNFQFNETPIVDPAQAIVRMPASNMKAVPADARLIARLDPTDLAQREVNIQHVIVNVPLVLPAASGVESMTMDPTAATVTLTITQKTKQTAQLVVPILLVAPISELQRYEVQLISQEDRLLHRVVLRGPNEVIDQITNKTIKVWAELRLNADDLEKAASKESASANVHMNMPPGVTPAEPPPAIKYRVIKKKQPAVAP